MILISHRGNISGKSWQENDPNYIDKALKKYDVEIDLWFIYGQLLLGHDKPEYKIDESYLEARREKLWIHCKTVGAFLYLYEDFNCFFHEKDDIIVTSKKHLITHVNYGPKPGCIAIMPERGDYSDEQIKKCSGICSDFIERYEHL